MSPAVDVSTELLDGARNLMQYAGVQPGMEVLIHTEPGFDDPRIVRALEIAVDECKAFANVMHTRHWDKQRDPAPPAFERAVEGCDVLIGQGEYLHTKNHYLQVGLFERGLIYINSEAKTVEAMSSLYGRFPAELMFAIGSKSIEKLTPGAQVQVTTPLGTDMRMTVQPETVGGYCYPYKFDSPGHKKGVPGGTTCFHPEDPVNGVMYIEGVTRGNKAPKGILDKPLILTVRDHRVVEADGELADWWREFMSTKGDENSGWVAECMWGCHPKAGGGGRGAANPHLLHFGLGNSIAYGGPTFSKTWQVMFMTEPTLTVNGEPLLDNGHLTILEDPEVRKVAAKYGDPDELLSQVPATLADQIGDMA